jgi:hypothetical protein
MSLSRMLLIRKLRGAFATSPWRILSVDILDTGTSKSRRKFQRFE